MADYQQKPNTGTLFPNDYKKTDKQPDWRGKWVDENGKEWQMAAWVKTGKSGIEFLSLSASEPYDKGTKPKPTQEPIKDCPQPEADDDSSDDLPF